MPVTAERRPPAILVVDDEPDLRDAIAMLLGEHYSVAPAEDAETAVAHLRTRRFQCIMLDLGLPGMDGLRFLERMRERDQRTPVIVLTGRRSVRTAVEAMRLGATDYLTKPFEPEELEIAVARAIERAKLVDRMEAFEAQAGVHRVSFADIITCDSGMRRVVDVARQMSQVDSRVLITGETGTGKELVARAIHEASARRDQPFVAVNCAAIPPDLAESEFFGHEKGAFTGAVRATRGRFELAHGGTLFLDEVICLPLDLQAKLLRVLQDGVIDRVGGEAPLRVDVRLISATNVDIRAEAKAGRFREDLYYRLNVVPLALPPLRERREDIPLLLEHFRAVVNARTRRTVRSYTPEAWRLLCAYDWPGNVRELEHTVERLVVLERTEEIGTDHLPIDIVAVGLTRTGLEPSPLTAEVQTNLRRAREEFEREFILRVLVRTGWNQTRAAALLGVNRNTLIAKMNQYGLRRAAKESAPAAPSYPLRSSPGPAA